MMAAGTKNWIGAVDQGTSSSRFIIFEANNPKSLAQHQIESQRLCPKDGWVEQDAMILLNSTLLCIEKTMEKMRLKGLDSRNIKAIGVTNQRETVIAWDKLSGKPLHNAIIWLDSRTTPEVDRIKALPDADEVVAKIKRISGLGICNYFSALKMKWLIENVAEVKMAVEEGRCLMGTMDSWLIWNMTGGTNGGLHMTDATNASRTMLMDIQTLQWDPFLCSYFKIPQSVLATIKSSSEIYGHVSVGGPLDGIPISGCLGDQQAALVGHKCFEPGQAKCTFGTGCFLLFNTGEKIVNTSHGLLTTVGYKLGPKSPTVYALEGSAGIAGAAMRWLRDNLCIASSYEELGDLAATVDDTDGVHFVPAFSGLFAPHWRMDARGIICGLSEHSTKAHIAKASFEATAFQVKDLLVAMNQECGFVLSSLHVDGGMTNDGRFMQLIADLLGIDALKPSMSEATALGAAMAAGYSEGIKVWDIGDRVDDEFTTVYEFFKPSIDHDEREARYVRWKDAVVRSFGWESNKGLSDTNQKQINGGP